MGQESLHKRGGWRWLLLAACLPLSACMGLPSTAPPPEPGLATTSPARLELLRAATRQLGTPYRYGGSDRRGFDCSGLVQYAHRRVGVEVPRTTRQQWAHARSPNRRHLLPGDLVFFHIDGGKGRHVGIYEGGGMFIHAPSSGKRVSRASLDNPYWRERMIGARTFL